MRGRSGASTRCRPRSCGDGTLKRGGFTLLLGSFLKGFGFFSSNSTGPDTLAATLWMEASLGTRTDTDGRKIFFWKCPSGNFMWIRVCVEWMPFFKDGI